MTVRLSQFRVEAGMNASGYDAGAKLIVASNERMKTTAGAVADAQERLDVVLMRNGRSAASFSSQLDRTIGGLDNTHRAAAQLVRTQNTLRNALETGRIAQDQHDRLMSQAAGRYRNAISVTSQLGAANDNLRVGFSDLGRAVAILHGPLGPLAGRISAVGAAISSVGVVTAAGLVGLAALTIAFGSAYNAAGRFAEQVGRLRDGADTLGLTTMQLQALNDAGSAFALTEDRISSGLQRFVSGLDELHRGQGRLYDTLSRIDPALARQMAGARDTASALDLMAQAYSRADTAARAALSRAAFGQQGFDVGLLIQGVGRTGGVDALTAQFRQSGDALERELIERTRVLQREIASMSDSARRNLHSIFSERMLEMQHRSTSMWLEMTRSARNFAMSSDLERFIEWSTSAAPGWLSDWSIWPTLLRMLPAIQELRTPGFVPPDPTSRARQDLARGLRAGRTFDGSDIWSPWPSEDEAKFREGAEFRHNEMRRWMQLLGQAATPAEQLRLKELELAAAAERLGASQDVVNRALGAFIDAQRQAEVAARSRLGIVTEEELQLRALAQVHDAVAKGHIRNEEERAEATRRLMMQARETYLSIDKLAGLQDRLSFERDTMFFSETDRQIAQEMKNIYGPEWQSNMDSALAAQVRLSQKLEEFSESKAPEPKPGAAPIQEGKRDVRVPSLKAA